MRYLITVVIAAFSLSSFGQLPFDFPSDGLVGWWNFDGQYQDQNGSDMMFQTNGSTSLGKDRFGQTDSAVQFFGDGSAVATNDGSVQQYGALSLSYWVKMQSVDAAVVALGASTGVSWTSWFGSVCGMYYASGCGDSFDAFAEDALLSESGSFQETWHHVVMTSQGIGEQFSVYVDGELFGSAISATGGSCYTTSIHLGVEIWSAPEYMTGFIDDLGIWNRQLNGEEVSQLFALSSTSGCTDETACNFDDAANTDDGSCDYSCCPGPGCCDVGTVWNIESQTCIVLYPSDSNFDGCVDLDDLLDLLGTYGSCISELPDFASCGDDIEHEGYSYSTVQIGEQCWFAENCRYLPIVSDLSINSTTEPHYSVYGYEGTDVTAAKATSNYATYGVLYNWPAVMTEGICPTGWHIPTDLEWQTMEMSLGMSASDASSSGWRGTDEGYQMKSTSDWNDYGNGNGSNSSGFTGLPGGYRASSGSFYSGVDGYWWSASESSSYSWSRTLYGNDDRVFRYDNNRKLGFSARCVRD
jgi:uncharacterized protein (TIGR02145 family)